VTRFRIAQEVAADTPYRQAMADYAPFAGDLAEPPSEVDFDRSRLLAALGAFLKSRNLDADWEAAETAPPEALIHQLCMHCPLEPAEKQALLEAPSLASRAQTLTALLEMSAAGGSGRILQ
jgi:Lon protease-like protein